MPGMSVLLPDMNFDGRMLYENSPFTHMDIFTLIESDLALQNPEEISLYPFPLVDLPRIEEEHLSSIASDNGTWDPQKVVECFKMDDMCNIPLTEPFINYINQDDDFDLTTAWSVLVNPKTASPVKKDEIEKNEIEKNEIEKKDEIGNAPDEIEIPYHPTQDHDYILINTDKKEVQLQDIEKLDADTAEPEVDVWKIENFADEQAPLPHSVNLQDFPYHPLATKETRRTSKRNADMKRRDQARLVSNAVHAVLNPKKPVRRYKNIRPKNSVETTPSQSDIEEWHSQAIRPTCSKITKKKTTKGRIDHSESERHRREVLRRHFHLLRGLIPTNFLMGEKATSQISKQKILTGAKRFMENLYSHKKSQKTFQHQNTFLKEQLCKLARYVKTTDTQSVIKRQKTF